MSTSCENFLYDLGYMVLERAKEAKERTALLKARAEESSDYYFQLGRQVAYYEVISTMINQAEVFEIPLGVLRLEGIRPDKDLV